MAKTEPRIDAYIAKVAPFAQPILTHLRKVVHQTLPEAEEAIKWSMPHFTYKGKILAGMAAFKAHATFGIAGDGRQGEAMGQYGKLTALTDLPSDAVLAEKILEGKARIDTEGSAMKPREKRTPKAEIPMPDDFAAALAAMQGVRERFEGMAPSCRREYLEWIVEAKRPETRAKRIEKAAGQIAEGKKLHWKYESC
ncbi:MAG: YdeI/OmpD-associated family protein [Novosphingobium sp.]